MFPYTEKYTESESDIQNNDLLYKIDHKCQNTFELFEKFPKFQKIESILELLAYFVKQIVILNIGFGFCVFFCIWEHTLKILFDICRPPNRKKSTPENRTFSQKCEQFSYRGFWALTNVKKEKYRCVVRIVLGRTDPYSKLTAGGVHPRKSENYSGRFPEGVQKEEIQQWRQARSRPREKETRNICWGGKMVRTKIVHTSGTIFEKSQKSQKQ